MVADRPEGLPSGKKRGGGYDLSRDNLGYTRIEVTPNHTPPTISPLDCFLECEGDSVKRDSIPARSMMTTGSQL